MPPAQRVRLGRPRRYSTITFSVGGKNASVCRTPLPPPVHCAAWCAGAVQFTYDQRLEFGLREHASKDGVLAALRAIPYMSGGTATGSAIAYAADNLFR